MVMINTVKNIQPKYSQLTVPTNKFLLTRSSVRKGGDKYAKK